MQEQIDLSVIIPARNEHANILSTLSALSPILAKESFAYEIIVIDDGSSDDTLSIVSKAQAILDTNIRPIRNAGQNGFGRAVRLGLSAAIGRFIVIYMADASDDPHDVIRYYNILNSGVDCVFGSRFIKNGSTYNYPYFKWIINRSVNFAIRILFSLTYNDITNAFKGYNIKVIKGCEPLISPHFNLTVELPLKAIVRGYSYQVIPISWSNRRHGVSSLKLQEMGSRYLYSLLIVYLERLLTGKDYRP